MTFHMNHMKWTCGRCGKRVSRPNRTRHLEACERKALIMRVECEVEEVELEADNGRTLEGVRVTCSRCQRTEESFGTSDRSIKRCFVLLKENCPMGENNFYVEEGS